MTYIKENIITKLQKLYSPPRSLRTGNKSTTLILKKSPVLKIFTERPTKDSQNLVKRTPVIRERTLVPPPRKKNPSKKQYQKRLENLSSKNACLEKELKDAYFKISKLEQELKVTKKIHLCDKKRIVNLQQKLLVLEKIRGILPTQV